MIRRTWHSKIPPETIKFAKIIAETIDIALEDSEEFLRMGDEAIQHLKSKKLPDWTRYYERSLIFISNFVHTATGIPKEKWPTRMPKGKEWIKELAYKFAEVDMIDREEEVLAFFEQHKTAFIISYRVLAHEMISLLQFGKPMKYLLKEAREGNDRSLFQALQIDKSLVGKRFIIERIREAELKNEIQFFEGLGRAIQRRPSSKRRRKAKLSMLLTLLWELGLEEMTVEEIFDFLWEVFDPATFQLKDPVTLRKLLNRIGLRKRDKQNVT